MPHKKVLVLVTLLALAVLLLAACKGAEGPAGPAGSKGDPGPAGKDGSPGVTQENVKQAIDARFTTADRNLPLWAVQPGTAPRMLELAQHFNIMWFAAQAGNWDVVTFESYRVDETLKANVVTRPARKDALEGWGKPVVEAINKASADKNLDAFIAAYDNAIVGCNACHAAQGGGPLKTMTAYKVTRPTAPAFSNFDLGAPQGAGVSLSTLEAVPVATAPALDGVKEAAWLQAAPLVINVANGANLVNGATAVELRAMHDAANIYFVAEWADPTESIRRMPWQKQADGSWKKLTSSTTHQENQFYEDKFAFIWDIKIADFATAGCTATCHPGEQAASGYGSKYSLNADGIGDIWHWKGVRTGTVGQIDDQYLDGKRPAEAAEAGRHSDPKTAGGYADNVNAAKNGPQSALPNNARANPGGPYWIKDSEKVAVDASKYAIGDEVPGIIVAPFSGDRGDISAQANWADGKWTLEWSRKLSTGSQYDVQFSDLTRAYPFNVAVFDNAQVNHAWAPGAYALKFSTAAPKGPAFPPAIPANHAGRTTCAACHSAGVGGAPKFPSAPDHTKVLDAVTTCTGCHKGP